MTCRYHSLESGTSSQTEPWVMDCWLMRPGRVKSMASWIPTGGGVYVRIASMNSATSQ
jgi:hypothetical protein